MTIPRRVETLIQDVLRQGKSVLLLGPRQTGKTTILKSLPNQLFLNLALTRVRQKYERSPDLLVDEVEALYSDRPVKVVVDEIQKVPSLLDNIQALIDDRKGQFVITGSSARKLKGGSDVNLLPGRVISIRMDALSLLEVKPTDLDELMAFGLLPEIFGMKKTQQRERLLGSYVEIYLEEEIRKEAIVKSVGAFGRFLELAAIESGQIVNFSSIAKDIGVSPITIQNYYEIIEQCLIAHRIEPITRSSTRKKLTRSSRYILFDMGVRRVAAREGTHFIPDRKGTLFEQWIALELIKLFHVWNPMARLRFWRDPGGPEVDWILECDNRYLPIEVKLTDAPTPGMARHMKTFVAEYPNSEPGIIVCTSDRKLKLPDGTMAWPWQLLPEAVEHFVSRQ